MNKLTIDKMDLKNKRVLVRVDFNVPLDEKLNVTDDRRIRESLPTIKKIIQDQGKAILMSHSGRPKGKVVDSMRLTPAARKLSELLGKPVKMASDCLGPEVEKMVNELQPGEVLMLDNLRFHNEEEANDPKFAEQLAKLGDVYINDAFGSAHRAHASTEGVTHFMKTCGAGYLMQKELDHLGKALENPKRPFLAIIGGAKISGKIDVIENLLKKVDGLLIGGAMTYTFYKAQGIPVGKSLVEDDKVELARNLLEKNKSKLTLPIDNIAGDAFDEKAKTKEVDREIPEGWMALDIGPKSIRQFTAAIASAKTIVWNGPVGAFEMKKFSKGTFAVAKALANATHSGAVTIVGGGDSAAAIEEAGLANEVTHVSTGGGASLEFLEGKKLPGVEALTNV